MSASMIYCPFCDRMIKRSGAEAHLQRDAERNDGSISPLELIGRMLAHNARGAS